jgi:hypothetical protein
MYWKPLPLAHSNACLGIQRGNKTLRLGFMSGEQIERTNLQNFMGLYKLAFEGF